jgi:carboxymethylenebutenolidase
MAPSSGWPNGSSRRSFREALAVCFDADSHPPIAPMAGAAVDGALIELTAADGNRFAGYRSRAAQPGTTRMLVLPDVRGLFTFYEELALRFAEAGIDALAIDYFGRTAGMGPRDGSFEYQPHVAQTTWAGLSADISAGVAELRADGHDDARVFAVGFCFGGRLAFDSATLGLGLAGVIGFYGTPSGSRLDIPAPADVAGSMGSPVLGLFGGADAGIPAEVVAAYDDALSAAGVAHELVSYPGAPHSFFDRKAAEYGEASQDAWRQVLAFVGQHASD